MSSTFALIALLLLEQPSVPAEHLVAADQIELAVSNQSDGSVIVSLYNFTSRPLIVGPLAYTGVVSDLRIQTASTAGRPHSMPSKVEMARWRKSRTINPHEFIGVHVPRKVFGLMPGECKEFSFRYSYTERANQTASRKVITKKICG